MISPLASTLAEDCRAQCSRRASLSVCAVGAAGLDAGVSAARRRCTPRKDISNNWAANRAGKSGRPSFAFAEFMLLPWVPSRARSIVSGDLGSVTQVRELKRDNTSIDTFQ